MVRTSLTQPAVMALDGLHLDNDSPIIAPTTAHEPIDSCPGFGPGHPGDRERFDLPPVTEYGVFLGSVFRKAVVDEDEPLKRKVTAERLAGC